ncbi:protein eiger [Lingula anatina]|uniref:Protein eiger n=1 Tax=Lingula anatina TaxID=7574 RepID=A0A1S3IKW2_LINAN|nr:protein eiger [Lingula anatina]|eukprot:XP_013398885.1 protein eiger [Lingula anatina]
MTAEEGLHSHVSAGKHRGSVQATHDENCATCGRCIREHREWVPAVVVAVLLLVALALCGIWVTVQLNALKDGLEQCERHVAHLAKGQRGGLWYSEEPPAEHGRTLPPPSPSTESNHMENHSDYMKSQNNGEDEFDEVAETKDTAVTDIFNLQVSQESHLKLRPRRSSEQQGNDRKGRRERQKSKAKASTAAPTKRKKKCPRRCRHCCIKGDKGDKGDPGPSGQMSLAAALYRGNIGTFDPESIPESRRDCDEFDKVKRTFRSCDGKLMYWEKVPWMNDPDHARVYENKFQKTWDGQVRVTEGGLYYLYGQITFYNASPFNTAGIDVNGHTVVRCTNSVPITNPGSASSTYQTCSMRTVWNLEENAEVQMVVKQPNRALDMRPDTTFFGLVKLNDVTEMMMTSPTSPQ